MKTKEVINSLFSVAYIDEHLQLCIFGIKISKRIPYPTQKAQKNIASLVQKVSNKIKNNEKIKVYFLIYDKSQWTFQSLYDVMDKDSLFDPYVLVFPAWLRRIDDKPNDDLLDFIKKLGLKYVTKIDKKELPDILFTPKLNFKLEEVPLEINKIYKKVLLCCHIYGWLLTNDDNTYFTHCNSKYFWKEYVPSMRDYNAAIQGPTKGTNVVCSGYLKNDNFDFASKKSNIWKQKNTKKIIYAPHYSLYNGGHALATFDKYYDKIYKYLEEHQEIEIVFKPHPLLRRFIGDKDYSRLFNNTEIKFMTLKDYDDYVIKWASLPNGSVMNSGNYYELFNSSDAIILDSESFVAEYMIQNKPMCFCNKYNSLNSIKSFMNQMGKDLLDAMTVAHNWEDIQTFIENVVYNKDSMAEKRTEVIKKYLRVNEGSVGKFIKDDIKQSLLS